MRPYHRFTVLLCLVALFASATFCQQQTTRTAPAILQQVNAASTNGANRASRVPFVPSTFKTFAAWKTACDRLPLNRQLRSAVAPRELLPIKSVRQFDEATEAFFADCKTGTLSQTNAWVGELPSRNTFLTPTKFISERRSLFSRSRKSSSCPAGRRCCFTEICMGTCIPFWLGWTG